MKLAMILISLMIFGCGRQEAPNSATNYVPTATNPTPSPAPKTVPEPDNKTVEAPAPSPVIEPKKEEPKPDYSKFTPAPTTPTSTPTVTPEPKKEEPKQVAPVFTPTPITPPAPIVKEVKTPTATLEVEKLMAKKVGDYVYEIRENNLPEYPSYQSFEGIAIGLCPGTECLELRSINWKQSQDALYGYTVTPVGSNKGWLWQYTYKYEDGSMLAINIYVYKNKLIGIEAYSTISGSTKTYLKNIEFAYGGYWRRYLVLPEGVAMDSECVNSPTHAGWVAYSSCRY